MNERPTGRPCDLAGGHRDARIPGDRRRRRAGADEVVAVDEIGRPGRAAGGRDIASSCRRFITASIPSVRARDAAGRQRRFDRRRDVSGPFSSAITRISWPKYGISRARSRSLNAIRSVERVHPLALARGLRGTRSGRP